MTINNLYKFIPDWFKIWIYKFGGSRPWSRGYSTFKFKYIKRVINNQEIMKNFGMLEPLPKNYGYSLDERVVEYPWVLSRIPVSDRGTLLDVGSVLNFKEILEFPSLKNKKITIVNIDPESKLFGGMGISYVFGDVRNMFFEDNSFDYITCISTLEHVGMDNTIYTEDRRYKENKFFDFEKAVSKLKKVLKVGGKVLITVPFGKYQNFGRFQQFDSKLINKVLECFCPRKSSVIFYKYTKDGWNVSKESECQDSEHFDVYKTKYYDKKSFLGFDPDLAAASRAVAFLELIK